MLNVWAVQKRNNVCRNRFPQELEMTLRNLAKKRVSKGVNNSGVNCNSNRTLCWRAANGKSQFLRGLKRRRGMLAEVFQYICNQIKVSREWAGKCAARFQHSSKSKVNVAHNLLPFRYELLPFGERTHQPNAHTAASVFNKAAVLIVFQCLPPTH